MSTAPKEKLDKIHAASIKILKETGIRLHNPKAVELFAQAGQKTEGDIVFPSEEFLMEQLKKAPANFTLKARDPHYDMSLGGGDSRHYAAGYGCPSILEADGTMRDATMADYIKFAKLVHQSPLFKINGGILAQPGEVAPPIGQSGHGLRGHALFRQMSFHRARGGRGISAVDEALLRSLGGSGRIRQRTPDHDHDQHLVPFADGSYGP